MTLAQRIGDYSSPNSLGSRLRRRRIAPFLDMIRTAARANGACSIIDIGGTEIYWSIVPPEFLAENNVSITLANIDETATAPSSAGVFNRVHADGCDLPYADKAFDLVHSNSVVEHVGDWARQLQFGREVSRVAHGYFVQTPNYWFPWEPHFGTPCLQFLPVPLQIRLLMAGRRGFSERKPTVSAAMQALDRCRLLDARRFAAIFPDAQIIRERFLGLSKSLIAVKPVENAG